MTKSTKKIQSPGLILLERLDQLRRKLETACDAFDELYSHVYYLQSRHRTRDGVTPIPSSDEDDQLRNNF
jgi:hypothetical protein